MQAAFNENLARQFNRGTEMNYNPAIELAS